MGTQIGFGQMGDAQQKFVNPLLGQKLMSMTNIGQGISASDIPTWGAIENIPGTTAGTTDLYRNVGAGTFSTSFLVEGRWGITGSRGSDGIAKYDLKSGWNTVKNASIVGDTADNVDLDGFVHFDADYSAVSSGVNVLTVTGSKSGNYLGGSAMDLLSIGIVSNGSGWNNDFRIGTGDGNDTVTISSLDLAGDGIAGDVTYTSGQFAQQAANTSGEWTTVFADLGNGNDTFANSSLAADKVWGGAGTDNIFTGAGDDFIDGGIGNDTLNGGTGADTFFFGLGAGIDTIGDFKSSEGDKLRFSTDVFSSAEQALASAYQNGADTWIDPGNDGVGDIVILKGILATSLTAADFFIG